MKQLSKSAYRIIATALSLLLLSLSPVGYADQTVSYSYNSLGLIETIDGARTDVNDITTFAYDSSGNRISITNALGHLTQITAHDLSGRPLTLIDANGSITQLVYDVRGRLLSQDSAGRLTTFNYDAVGNITQISQSNGQVISYSYDSAHRPTGYSDALGNSVVYTLDLAGNQTQQDIYDPTNQLTRTHRFIYDELNRLRADIGADNQTATLDYDTNSNLTDQSDANGNPTSYAFDGLNRLIDSTDADNGQTTYGYDDNDNLTSVTDANGNTTTYTYDAFDNLIEQNSPDTGLSSFTYDEANNRLSQTDARGRLTTYQYDTLNRIIYSNYADTILNISYRYDENNNNQHGIGRLTSQTDAAGDTHYRYDIRGNLIDVSTERGADILQLSYHYNSSDQLTQMTYSDGRTVDYSYDIAGQLSHVSTTDNQGNSQSILSDITYQPFGPMTSQLFGNSVTAGKTIDQDYRQASMTTLGIIERAYNFDANSNIISITDLIEANNSQSFNYDTLNRLDHADSHQYGVIDYQYDAVHNRTNKATLINPLTLNEDYQYASNSNRLIQKSAGTNQDYQYDANGNITDNGHYQFSYGQDNRLHVVSQGGQTIAAYNYNAQGQRSVKIANGTTTYYLYSPSGQLLTETNTFGQTQKNYIYANGQLIAIAVAPTTHDQDNDGIIDSEDNCSQRFNPNQIDSDNDGFGNRCDGDFDNNGYVSFADLSYFRAAFNTSDPHADLDSNGNVSFADLSIFRDIFGAPPGPGATTGNNNNVLYYVHNDHLGTPQTITDQNQQIVWHALYDPFGKATIITQTLENNIRFPGQYYDKETGLHYNYFRYYDPELGRYITSDPIGLAGGVNTFGYVEGNPVGYSDPSGLTKRGAPGTPSTIAEVFAQQSVNSLVNQIRYYNPGFQYPTVRPTSGPGSRSNRTDVQFLEQTLRDYQTSGICPLIGQGTNPAFGTRSRPKGLPESWRIRPTRGKGGTEYYNPQNLNETVRVMQGNPSSPYPNSQNPYARQRDSSGSYRNENGTRGENKSPDTHIPYNKFRFRN